MRVLAIAQPLRQPARRHPATRGRLADRGGHPGGHRRVIGPRPRIGNLCQPLPEAQGRGPVMGGQLVQKRLIILDIHHDVHKGMVLGRCPDHRGAADVDILDAGLVVGALGDRLLEGVKVHHQKVDLLDPMRDHRADMGIVVAQRQKPAMHSRMQGLDPAIHHLGKTRHIRHILDHQPRCAQRRRRSARGQKVDPPRRQRLTQLDQAGLVGYGNQRAAHWVQVGRHGLGPRGRSALPKKGLKCHIHLVPVQVADADGRILRLGQRPPGAGRIVHRAAG